MIGGDGGEQGIADGPSLLSNAVEENRLITEAKATWVQRGHIVLREGGRGGEGGREGRGGREGGEGRKGRGGEGREGGEGRGGEGGKGGREKV